MTYFEKWSIKAQFYLGLSNRSIAIELFKSALIIGLASVLCGKEIIQPKVIGSTLGILSLEILYFYFKPINMSRTYWSQHFNNPQTIEVILNSFDSEEKKLAFLSQKDRLGETALSSLVDFSYKPTDQNKSELEHLKSPAMSSVISNNAQCITKLLLSLTQEASRVTLLQLKGRDHRFPLERALYHNAVGYLNAVIFAMLNDRILSTEEAITQVLLLEEDNFRYFRMCIILNLPQSIRLLLICLPPKKRPDTDYLFLIPMSEEMEKTLESFNLIPSKLEHHRPPALTISPTYPQIPSMIIAQNVPSSTASTASKIGKIL